MQAYGESDYSEFDYACAPSDTTCLEVQSSQQTTDAPLGPLTGFLQQPPYVMIGLVLFVIVLAVGIVRLIRTSKK